MVQQVINANETNPQSDAKLDIQHQTITSLIRYLVLIPILAPKGIDDIVPGYKMIMTIWAMVSLGLILFDTILQFHSRNHMFSFQWGLVAYYFVAIVVSILSTKGVTNGLQTLFFYPAVFIYIIGLSEEQFKKYITAVAHILLIIFIIYIIVNPLLNITTYHLTILGHIQTFSQYGLLTAVVTSMLIIKKWSSLKLSLTLICVCIYCMVTAEADSARLGVLVFIIVSIFFRVMPGMKSMNAVVSVIVGILLNVFVVWITVSRQSPLMGSSIDWTFTGRYFVWESAIGLIKKSPWIGYGVENSDISTFWEPHMTYAHNQVLQSLIDGGVILFLFFLIQLITVGVCINRVKDPRIRKMNIAFLITLLVIMIFDGFTLYGYIFVALAIVSREGICYSRS